MAFTFGFYNSLNGDRKYNAEQMSAIFDGLIKDGVYDTIGQLFAVRPSTGMQITVGTGRAWFDHTWNNNDALLPLVVSPADITLPRYDTVVLEVNSAINVRQNGIKIIKGVAATNPTKPILTNSGDIHQHALAHIRVDGGATSITESNIQVVVGTSECPFVTGIIQTAQIDALFQQWNGEFYAWWENVKKTLNENTVTNLQNQIDDLKTATGSKITNSTAETLGVANGTTVDTALATIGKNISHSIGDIFTTYQTISNTTTNWNLCDGGSISKVTYKKTASIIDPNLSRWGMNAPVYASPVGVHGCGYNSDNIVFVDDHSGSTVTLRVFDNKSDIEVSTTKNISLPVSVTSIGFILYHARSGKWLIGATSGTTVYIFSSTTYNGTYSTASTVTNGGRFYFARIISNGEFFASCGSGLFYIDTGGIINIISFSSTECFNVDYYNGQYYVFGRSNNSGNFVARLSSPTLTSSLALVYILSNQSGVVYNNLMYGSGTGSSGICFYSSIDLNRVITIKAFNGSDFTDINLSPIPEGSFYESPQSVYPVTYTDGDNKLTNFFILIGNSDDNPTLYFFKERTFISSYKLNLPSTPLFSTGNALYSPYKCSYIKTFKVFDFRNGTYSALNFGPFMYYFGPSKPRISISDANTYVWMEKG